MAWKKGVPQSEEHKQKRRQKLKGRVVTWGHKISIANKASWKRRKINFKSSSKQMTRKGKSGFCQKCGKEQDNLFEIEVHQYAKILKYCKKCYERQHQNNLPKV